MAGRSRGRGRGILSSNVTPVTPGGGDYEALLIKLGHIRSAEEEKSKKKDEGDVVITARSKVSLSQVEEVLQNLELSEEEDQDLGNIRQMSTDAAQTGDDLKKIADLIYKKCLEDRNFVKFGATICGQLCSLEVEGTKFRNCVLSLLQKDFKEKEELRKSSSAKFLCFLSTLCQMFAQMRTASGELFKPLVGPVCESIEHVLDEETDNSADECELISLQLQNIGKELDSVGSERLNKLMEKVRTKIINNGTTPRIRCILLEVLECYLRKFDDLPNDTTRFYCDTTADILAGMVV